MATKLPTLSELIGLDKFNLTLSERSQCVSLYNHRGETAALLQAQKFHNKTHIKAGVKIKWLDIINGGICRLSGEAISDPNSDGCFDAIGMDEWGNSFKSKLMNYDVSISIIQLY